MMNNVRLKNRAVPQVSDSIAHTRWLLFTQSDPIPMPFLIVLIFWISIIFANSACSRTLPIVVGALFALRYRRTSCVLILLVLQGQGQPFSGVVPDFQRFRYAPPLAPLCNFVLRDALARCTGGALRVADRRGQSST